jgi:hypothetical protein
MNNNFAIYVAWALAIAFFIAGLGWFIGIGIGAALFMAYAIAVDCANGIIAAIQGRKK